MKFIVACLAVVFIAGGCARTETRTLSANGIAARILGTPDSPYVSASDKDETDLVLEVKAIHLSSGTELEDEIKLRKDSTVTWIKCSSDLFAGGYLVKNGKTEIYYGSEAGVEMTFDCSENGLDGKKLFNDSAKVLLPFNVKKRGIAGPFSYEAIWRKGP